MVNSTRCFSVPYMTNTKALVKGEELIMQQVEPKQKPTPKRTWKDAMRDEQKENERKKTRLEKQQDSKSHG